MSELSKFKLRSSEFYGRVCTQDEAAELSRHLKEKKLDVLVELMRRFRIVGCYFEIPRQRVLHRLFEVYSLWLDPSTIIEQRDDNISRIPYEAGYVLIGSDGKGTGHHLYAKANGSGCAVYQVWLDHIRPGKPMPGNAAARVLDSIDDLADFLDLASARG